MVEEETLIQNDLCGTEFRIFCGNIQNFFLNSVSGFGI